VEERGRLFFWIVVAVAAALLLLRLGTPALIDPDEARFARTTVEMVRSGDLVVPTFEGVPRAVKPPLLHWIQAAFFRLLGPGGLSARLPAALATLGALFLVAWVARRRFGEEGAAWAAAIFITTPLVVVIGRLGTIDALLSVHVFAALAIDMAEYGETGPNRGAVIGALLGLAFLAKGPVGVVLPLLMMLAGRTAAGRNVLPQGRAVLGFAAGLLVAVPWSAVFIRRLGIERALGTLRTEAFERYFAGTDHVQPAWYFAAVVLVAFSPWVGPLAVALVRAMSLRRDPVARTGLYAAGAFLAALLFFSIGRGKLPHYILPAAPLAALLVTWELGQALSAPKERRTGALLLTGALFAEAIVLGALAAVFPMEAARVTGSIAALAYGIAALTALWGLLGQRPRVVYGAAAAAGAALLLTSALVLHPALASNRSAAALVETVPELQGDSPLVVVDIRLPSLTYYLDRSPEAITAGEIDRRLDHDDSPILILAAEDLARVPRTTRARMRELGRAGKLHALSEIDLDPDGSGGRTP
jgi:4-amino-4-deoxy-L-arabinose transferase-like glycosyltransferase